MKKVLYGIMIFIILISLSIVVNATNVRNGENDSRKFSFNNVNIDSSVNNASDVSVTTSSIIRTVGSIITIFQIFVFPIITIFFGIKGIILLRKKEKNKGKLYIVLAIIPQLISWWVQSVKSFKPIIYIYPEEEKDVKVKLGKKEKLTCTYPKYEDEWNVKAHPNGDLVDLKTGRMLYALYWEGLNTNMQNFEDGFIVQGENVASFLEEKLEILGLNERETEEFIVYWLPQMEHNKYNYIRFETIDEINENMPLEIIPKPETIIRINMVFKPLRKIIDVKEQELKQITRKGYTIVEWGGSKI